MVNRSLFRFSPAVVSLLLVVSSVNAVPRDPTNEEVALLVLANEARAYPAADRNGTEPIVLPMLWSDALANAAVAHSEDMAANQGGSNPCFQHNSCNGTSFTNRLTKYYPGWSALGENIAFGLNDPRWNHDGWMASLPHRRSILSGSFNDFGAGDAGAMTNFGVFTLSTENFGTRGMYSLTSYPTIVAASVIPTVYYPDISQKDFLLNYFHHNGQAPQAIQARVGNTCINDFAKTNAAAANHATYKATRIISGSTCVPVVFETIRSDGQYFRYPQTGSILVGAGSAQGTCARYSSALPTASCSLNPGDEPEPEDDDNNPAPTGQSLVPTASVVSTGKFSQKMQFKIVAKQNGEPVANVKLTLKMTGPKVIKTTIKTRRDGVAIFNRAFNRKTESGNFDVIVTGTITKKVNGIVQSEAFAGSGASMSFTVKPFGQ